MFHLTPMVVAIPKYRFSIQKGLTVLALLVVLPGTGVSQNLTVRLGREVEISLPGTDNHNPALTVVNDAIVYAVWESRLTNGQRRIVFREQVEGEWLPAVVVDRDPAGDNRLPVLGADSHGRPHIAWIATINGQRRPMYATRLGVGQSTEWNVLPIPDPEPEKLEGACDFVNLRMDDIGNPWVAWQCGYGNIYTIVASTLMPLGSMESFNLTPGATGHNLFPEILMAESPVIAWYAAQQDSFEVDAKRFVQPAEWVTHTVDDLEYLPAENFPNVFQRDSGPVTAVWYHRPPTAQSDRIYLGEQSSEEKGRGRIIDEQPQAKNTSVAGDRSARAIMATWASRGRDAMVDIILAYGNSAGNMQTIKVNRSEHLTAGNPKVSSVESKAAVIWESDADIGSVEGDILYRDLRF